MAAPVVFEHLPVDLSRAGPTLGSSHDDDRPHRPRCFVVLHGMLLDPFDFFNPQPDFSDVNLTDSALPVLFSFKQVLLSYIHHCRPWMVRFAASTGRKVSIYRWMIQRTLKQLPAYKLIEFPPGQFVVYKLICWLSVKPVLRANIRATLPHCKIRHVHAMILIAWKPKRVFIDKLRMSWIIGLIYNQNWKWIAIEVVGNGKIKLVSRSA